KDVAIAAVDSKSVRKQLYPDYKKYRNVDKDAVLEMVWSLRREVENDKLLPLCQIDGLEADDLVACWQIFNPDDVIVGVDKDFFQLPNEPDIFYHNMKSFDFNPFVEHLPNYVQELASQNFALYQILLGDVADNIPRLLAKGKQGKQQIEEVLKYDDFGEVDCWLLDNFGEQAKINAGLVLLPFYTYCDFDIYTFNDWFECWALGHYYDQGNWQRLYLKMQQCMLPNRVKQDVETLKMFSLV
ncbi:MAG: hypothetical protein EKK64_03780, partial [Neisseriaceae bacterium]